MIVPRIEENACNVRRVGDGEELRMIRVCLVCHVAMLVLQNLDKGKGFILIFQIRGGTSFLLIEKKQKIKAPARSLLRDEDSLSAPNSLRSNSGAS